MQTIIVTGANGHLGLEVVRYFLETGYRVLATVRSEKAVATIPAHDNVEVKIVDLNSAASCNDFVQDALSRHGQVDAACMLAGGFAMGDLASTGIEAIHQQIGLNFETAYTLTQALYPAMLEAGKGKLIFIGARPAFSPAHGKSMVAYSLAKSLLTELAALVNASAKGTDLTATVLAPATIDTPPNREAMPGANTGDWVSPRALAELIEFVVSGKGQPLRELVLKAYGNG